jgi:hypothetical protein
MNMNPIGKFEMRTIVNQLDANLIHLYGLSMLDARITRHEALNAYSEFHCPQRAAEAIGVRRGLIRINLA